MIDRDKAFLKLYHEIRDRAMSRSVKFFRGDVQKAEDSVQRSFMVAWQKIHTANPKYYKSWFYRLHTNEMLMMVRRKQIDNNTTNMAFLGIDYEEDFFDLFLDCYEVQYDERIDAKKIMSYLSDKHRKIIEYKIKGMTNLEAVSSVEGKRVASATVNRIFNGIRKELIRSGYFIKVYKGEKNQKKLYNYRCA